jgi:hypothetical protein
MTSGQAGLTAFLLLCLCPVYALLARRATMFFTALVVALI